MKPSRLGLEDKKLRSKPSRPRVAIVPRCRNFQGNVSFIYLTSGHSQGHRYGLITKFIGYHCHRSCVSMFISLLLVFVFWNSSGLKYKVYLSLSESFSKLLVFRSSRMAGLCLPMSKSVCVCASVSIIHITTLQGLKYFLFSSLSSDFLLRESTAAISVSWDRS